MNSDDLLVLAWEDVFRGVRELAQKIYLSKYVADVIIGVFRNGWIVGRLLGDLLGVEEIGGIGIKFYRGIGETRERPLVISGPTINVRDQKVLLVDDVSDSGRTLQTAIDLVRLYGAKEIRTATLYIKKRTMLVPDYYNDSTDKWIVFPWEYGEIIREISMKRFGDLSLQSIKKTMDLLRINDEGLMKIIYESSMIKLRRV